MVSGVDRLADVRDGCERAGRGFVVQDADRLDLLVLVLAQLGLDRLWIGAIFFHSVANWPVSTISTLSPGDSVLVSAPSQAPVPVAV
jgi:hypothetical protein